MKLIHIMFALCVAAALGLSFALIPDKEQLAYMAENKDHIEKDPAIALAEKQASLEAKIAAEGLDAQTVTELADSYVSQGKTDKAIEIMERYHAKEPKNIEMLDKLAVIYHVAGMEDKYIDILEEENDLLPSVNTSYILLAHFSQKYGDTQPDRTARTLRHLVKLQPENLQNYKNLIFFLLKAGRTSEVVDVVQVVRQRFPGQIDYGFIFPLVEQLIKLKKYDEAFNEADMWVKQNPDPALVDFSTMFINAGRADLAIKLMENEQQVAALKNAEYLLLLKVKALLHKNPERALQEASAYMKEHPENLKALNDFGNLFFTEQHFSQLVTLYLPFRKEVFADAKLLDIYREALLKDVKKHPEHLPQLVEIYRRELDDPKTTPQRRKSVVVMMQDIGAGKEALDYAEKYAFASRGDWVMLYENMLKKQGDKKRLAAFRFKYVHTMPLTTQEKRYYLSIYMEQDNKLEVERLLWDLAKNQPPKSRDVRDLIYIWGVNPAPQQLAWIEKRAQEAKGEEKVEWLEILSNIGAYEAIIRVVTVVPPEERTKRLLSMYFDALRLSNNQSVLKAEVATGLEEEKTEEKLALYAKTAQELGMFKPAAGGYERLTGMDPNNIEYIKERGMIAYYEGDVEAATAYLDDYYGSGGEDFMAVFYFAELLQQRNTQQARPLFEQTLLLMDATPQLTAQERVIRIHTLGRLHRYAQARRDMDQLLAENPDNQQLKLDNVEFMIDVGEYDKAEKELDRNKLNTRKNQPSQLWRLYRTHLLRTEARSRPNEILLVYDQRTDKLPLIKRWQEHHPEWIVGVYPGYDTVLIAAEPGKQLTATVQGDNLILEAVDAPSSAQSADKNFAIRHELLYARLEQETHRGSEAIDRLTALNEKHPKTVSVISGLAIAKRAYGQRLQAMDLAEEAHTLEPENRWVNIMLADMKKVDQPYIRGDVNALHMKNNTQFMTQISGMQPVNRNWKLAATAENNLYSFKDLRRGRGNIDKKSGAAQRGSVDAIYESEQGPIYRSSLFLNDGASVGLGEHITAHNALGQVIGFMEYRRADWLWVERIPDHALRNRVGVIQYYAPKPDIFSSVGVYATQYDQDNADNAARTVSLTGNITAPLSRVYPDFNDPAWLVGYGLDAEYITSAKRAISPTTGDYYRLHPVVSREVHFANLTYRHSFSDSVTGSLTGSYAYNRLNDQNGPIIAGQMTRELDKHWEMQMRASYGTNFTQMGNGMLTAGGYLIRKF
ncbi:MAG: tetratricopeptide repeat protein [Rickettsiales bacterium]|nr:tetratricopeptide repeat protein [Rickettsiales bacterium]